MNTSWNPSPVFRTRRAFSLLELIIVITIITLLAGLVAPALHSLGSSSLKATGREVAGQLVSARASTLAEREIHAVGIVTADPANPDANFRAAAILRQDKLTGEWEVARPRVTLPQGQYFEPTAPVPPTSPRAYVASSAYSIANPTISSSAHVLDYGQTVTVDETVGSGIPNLVTYRIVSYKPNGAAEMPVAGSLNYHLLIVEATNNGTQTAPVLSYTKPQKANPAFPSNWVHISTDRLTGRVAFFQP